MMMLKVIFLLCLCSLHVVTATASTSSRTNETDQEALLAVRSQIAEDPLGALSSWNASIHFCRWQGVTCGRRHQRVVSLDLGSLKLSGQLSPHIGNLTFLTNIRLTNNSFHGIIPQELGRLYRLQILDLWSNSFQGEIPLNLTNCRRLRELVLVNNQLGGKIPDELGSLSQLLVLGLETNNFVGTIPPSIGNLSKLSMHSIAHNHIKGSIPFELGQLSNLEILSLSGNQLSGSIPIQLFNISSIQLFDLNANDQIQGELPPNLCFNTPNLRELNLGLNKLSGVIPQSLTNCSRLASLSMPGNGFTGQLPANLGRLQNLQAIMLDGNRLEVPSTLGFLITSLTNCTNLNYLSLFKNSLRGSLPKSIGNLSSSLTMLRLGENPITGGIPSEIGNLAGLQTLSLQETRLSGHIPSSIGKLYNLRAFRLYSTEISGAIPSSLGNITYLSRLYLSSNFLQGPIPESLGNCSYLEALNLGDNRLMGEIPKKVVQLSSLTLGLSLAGNNLVGPLPSEVSKLINANSLDFSNNKLSGRIPSSLESCQVLEVLDISGNLFYGDIPHSLRKTRGLRMLDVSRNNLSGQIPEFLGELSLTSLNLSYNSFEGKVPTTGVFKNVSAFSISGNGKLCGGIKELKLPECPIKVSKKKAHVSRKATIVVSLALCISFLAACLFIMKRRMRKSKQKNPSSPSLFKEKHQRISYSTLFDSTNGFSSANIIGKGRYGIVYKGTLPDDDEQMIAVKVFNLQERRADKIFTAECETLKAIRHRNLVKIITACSSIDFQGNDFKALVFEFMPNGDLQSWLHPRFHELQQEPRKLNLIQRLDIAVDIASALLYLHTDCDTMMVHCDLKPSNILLDNDLKACVSDFGLTKSLSMVRENSSHAQSSSTGVRGTMGYIAPEYGIGEGVSTSGDMYSFGVLLMELFTSKSPTENEFVEDMSLHEYVKMALPQGVTEIVDPIVLDEELIRHGKQESVREGLVSVLQIGLSCSMDSPKERMNIKQAFKELQKARDMLIRSVFSQQMRRGGL